MSSNGSIKPIETSYNGYRFRSRLEARWAVYFDALGLEYQYESEGYEIATGVWYLPDFYFPDLDCFAEVKPKQLDHEEFNRCRNLHRPCLLLDGVPDNERVYYVTGVDVGEPDTYHRYTGPEWNGFSCWYGWVQLEQSVKKGRLWFLFGEHPDDYHFSSDASDRARSARFEHGEYPAVEGMWS
jgi:hypothetical protein